DNTTYLSLCATAYSALGKHELAIALYRQLLAASPESPELYVALGHSLRSIGRQKDAIACYHHAADIRSSFGDAYWSLANLKTYRLSQDEIARMRAEEAASTINPVD